MPCLVNKSTRLVIFDCDGTIVDSQHMICAAMERAFAGQELPCPPREELLSIVGLSLPIAFQTLGNHAPDLPVEGLVENYKAAFAAMRAAGDDVEPLYPGAMAAIESLAAMPDTLLGIATGKSQRGVRAVLARHGLLDRFHTIKTADDAPSKPHPGMVLEGMREAGVEPAQTIVIGDTSFDMEMARAAGAGAIGVSWGYHKVERLHQAGAQIVIDGYADLAGALESVWPELAG